MGKQHYFGGDGEMSNIYNKKCSVRAAGSFDTKSKTILMAISSAYSTSLFTKSENTQFVYMTKKEVN